MTTLCCSSIRMKFPGFVGNSMLLSCFNVINFTQRTWSYKGF